MDLTPYERELFLKVLGSSQFNLPYLHVIYKLVHREAILRILISKGLTGKVLEDFIFSKCGREPIRFMKFCLKELHKSNNPCVKFRI